MNVFVGISSENIDKTFLTIFSRQKLLEQLRSIDFLGRFPEKFLRIFSVSHSFSRTTVLSIYLCVNSFRGDTDSDLHHINVGTSLVITTMMCCRKEVWKIKPRLSLHSQNLNCICRLDILNS